MIALVPGSFDAPAFHQVRDGVFGKTVDLDRCTDAQLFEYEADLLLLEAHVCKELDVARRALEAERRRREVAA